MNIEMIDLTIQLNNHENSNQKKIISNIFLIFELVPWKTFGQLTEYESNIPNGELFRIKAVCTHVRHDPVYKVN